MSIGERFGAVPQLDCPTPLRGPRSSLHHVGPVSLPTNASRESGYPDHTFSPSVQGQEDFACNPACFERVNEDSRKTALCNYVVSGPLLKSPGSVIYNYIPETLIVDAPWNLADPIHYRIQGGWGEGSDFSATNQGSYMLDFSDSYHTLMRGNPAPTEHTDFDWSFGGWWVSGNNLCKFQFVLDDIYLTRADSTLSGYAATNTCLKPR